MSKKKFSPFLKVTKCINPPIPEGLDSVVERIKEMEGRDGMLRFASCMNLISELDKYLNYLRDDVHKVEVYDNNDDTPSQVSYMYGEDILESFLPGYERMIPNIKIIRE